MEVTQWIKHLLGEPEGMSLNLWNGYLTQMREPASTILVFLKQDQTG